MTRKHHIPGPEHTLGDPQTAQLWAEVQALRAENKQLRAELDAEELCEEFAETQLERQADGFARLRERIKELERQVAGYKEEM